MYNRGIMSLLEWYERRVKELEYGVRIKKHLNETPARVEAKLRFVLSEADADIILEHLKIEALEMDPPYDRAEQKSHRTLHIFENTYIPNIDRSFLSLYPEWNLANTQHTQGHDFAVTDDFQKEVARIKNLHQTNK